MSLLADAGTSSGDAGTQQAAATTATTATTQQAGTGTTTTQQTQTATTSTTTDKPWFSQWFNEKGEFGEKSWDGLPAEFQAYKDSFKQHKNLNSFLMQHVNLQSLAGKKGLAPLPEGASQQAKDERAALLRQINRTPEKIEDYGIKKPDDIPDALWDSELANVVLGALHKHAASPEMVRDIFEADRQSTLAAIARDNAAKEEFKASQLNELRELWKGPEYDKNMDLAIRAAKTAGIDPYKSSVFSTAEGIKMAAFYGSHISEDRLVSGDSQQHGGGSDKVRAMDIINNSANPLHVAYHDPSNPMHEQAKSQVNTLMASASKAKR